MRVIDSQLPCDLATVMQQGHWKHLQSGAAMTADSSLNVQAAVLVYKSASILCPQTRQNPPRVPLMVAIIKSQRNMLAYIMTWA